MPLIHKYCLENKATVLIKEYRSIPVVSLVSYFHGGVAFETKENNGISNLAQKLLLKGTRKRSAMEFAIETEGIGSLLIPFTSKDAFGCYMTLLSKDLEKGLDLFLDAVYNPAFYNNEVEKERQNIYAEIKESRDEILSYTLELCDKAVFDKHPYSFSIKGGESSLAAVNRSHLKKWHEKFYQPDNMIFSLVGDVEPYAAKTLLEKYLTQVKSANRNHRVSAPAMVDVSKKDIIPKKIAEEREKRQLSLAIGFLAPGIGDPDHVVFDVLNSILSGMGSRLFIELRDKKGLAYVVSSRYDATLKVGVFKTYIATSQEQEDVSREGLLEELFKLKKVLVSDNELKRAKSYMLGLYEISFQKTVNQALRYARFERMGLGASHVDLYAKKVEKVTKEDVRHIAKKYLQPERAGFATVRPKNS